MASKPDKFGIKFWCLADTESKYLCNAFSYLGKDPLKKGSNPLSLHVCEKLMTPYFNKGYNVTMDNFFTSLELAELFLSKKTTIIGTIRKHRREVPALENEMKTKQLYSNKILSHKSKCSLTVYKGKKNKNVYLMSTMHPNVRIDNSHPKKLPETIEYYNKSKVGVDIIDQMARYNTCKAGTRRWPVACFHNMLDLCAINAWILYKETIHAASY